MRYRYRIQRWDAMQCKLTGGKYLRIYCVLGFQSSLSLSTTTLMDWRLPKAQRTVDCEKAVFMRISLCQLQMHKKWLAFCMGAISAIKLIRWPRTPQAPSYIQISSFVVEPTTRIYTPNSSALQTGTLTSAWWKCPCGCFVCRVRLAHLQFVWNQVDSCLECRGRFELPLSDQLSPCAVRPATIISTLSVYAVIEDRPIFCIVLKMLRAWHFHNEQPPFMNQVQLFLLLPDLSYWRKLVLNLEETGCLL